jgi:hypothetical protein
MSAPVSASSVTPATAPQFEHWTNTTSTFEFSGLTTIDSNLSCPQWPHIDFCIQRLRFQLSAELYPKQGEKMKHFWQWLLGVISRKIAADYASGKNGWNEAIQARKTLEGIKRLPN